jgi:Raf kinase inhibitor-like YbhB/YbcL family protein
MFFSLLGCSVLTAAVLAGCNSDGRTLRPADPTQNQSVYTPTTTTTLVPDTDTVADAVSPATDAAALTFVLNLPWLDGGQINARYTCNGADVQPQISWLGAPANAVEMALVATDTDSGDFVHWIVAGLDPHDPLIGENATPVGAIEGQNGFSTAATPVIGWRGPCPPAGTPHHYRFTLYALDQQVELPTGSSAADLQSVIDASSIAAAQTTGVYATP